MRETEGFSSPPLCCWCQSFLEIPLRTCHPLPVEKEKKRKIPIYLECASFSLKVYIKALFSS